MHVRICYFYLVLAISQEGALINHVSFTNNKGLLKTMIGVFYAKIKCIIFCKSRTLINQLDKSE